MFRATFGIKQREAEKKKLFASLYVCVESFLTNIGAHNRTEAQQAFAVRFRKLLALGNCLPHVDADKLEDLVRLLPLPKTYLGTRLPYFNSYLIVYYTIAFFE